jgi:hypothetical protein
MLPPELLCLNHPGMKSIVDQSLLSCHAGISNFKAGKIS